LNEFLSALKMSCKGDENLRTVIECIDQGYPLSEIMLEFIRMLFDTHPHDRTRLLVIDKISGESIAM
jgi:hypothetical protein